LKEKYSQVKFDCNLIDVHDIAEQFEELLSRNKSKTAMEEIQELIGSNMKIEFELVDLQKQKLDHCNEGFLKLMEVQEKYD
jgi:hypothetical protein